MRRLDLDRPRDWTDLLYDTATVWLRHAPVFLVLAAIVVVPVVLLPLPDVVRETVAFLVVPGIVTAMHVVAVQDIAARRRPRLLHSIGVAVRLAPQVVATVVLYLLAVAAGLLALLVPGLYLAVALYFGPLVVVAERRRPVESLRRSRDVVKYDWPRVFLLLFFISLVTPAVDALLDALLSAVLEDETIRSLLAWPVAVSVTALATTLLFFDLRARTAID